MKTALQVFFNAIGLYLLLTIPAIFLPPLYLMSVMYMIMYGGIAGIIFATSFYFLQLSGYNLRAKMGALYFTVVPSVAIAFHMMEVLGSWPGVWQSGAFMLFPFMAIVAGWISLYQSRKLIAEQFTMHLKTSINL